MNKKFKIFFIGGIVLLACVLLFNRGFVAFAQEDQVEVLKKRIESLQKRVEELEAGQVKAAQKAQEGARGYFKTSPDRWDPFSEIYRMQAEMDRMFQDSFFMGGPTSKGMFRSNMYYDDTFAMEEKEDKYVMEFDMAGMNEGKIDIQVNQRSLTVKGEQKAQRQDEGLNRSFSSQSYATFMKTISVPPDADTSRMTTENKGGKLIITLPKKTI
jgi:HSP20 family protein